MNIDRILAAAARLEGHAVRTPLLNAPLLDAEAGRRECEAVARNLPERVRTLIGGRRAPDVAVEGMEVLSDFSSLDAILRR